MTRGRVNGGNKGKWLRVGQGEEVSEVWNRVNRAKGISFLQIHDRLFN